MEYGFVDLEQSRRTAQEKSNVELAGSFDGHGQATSVGVCYVSSNGRGLQTVERSCELRADWFRFKKALGDLNRVLSVI